MQKLPSGALEQIKRLKVRSLLNSEHTSGLKKSIRGYIVHLLQEEKKTHIEPNDFALMEGYIKNLQEYYNILRSKLPNKDFSLVLVEKLILGQTPQEFEALCDNKNVRDVVKHTKEKNLENIIGLCKTPEEFITLCDNKHVRHVLESAKGKNLRNVINLSKTQKAFETLCNNENVLHTLRRAKERNLGYIIENYTPEISKKIIENIDYKVINTLNIENIGKHKLGKEFGFFIEAIKVGIDLEKIDFPITKSNFLDAMSDDEILVEFEKDSGMKFEGIKPWTKLWFLEDSARLDYLNKNVLDICKIFGTEMVIGMLESTIDVLKGEHLKSFEYYTTTGIYKRLGSDIDEKIDSFKHIDYYAENEIDNLSLLLQKDGHAVVFSKIDESNKYSIDYSNCTAVVAIGKDQETGENISIITHQDPQYFLLDEQSESAEQKSKKELFIENLEKILCGLRERSEKGTVDVLILGGSNNDNFQEFNSSKYLLNAVIYKTFGFNACIVGGPSVNPGDKDKDIYINTKERKVCLSKYFEKHEHNYNEVIGSQKYRKGCLV